MLSSLALLGLVASTSALPNPALRFLKRDNVTSDPYAPSGGVNVSLDIKVRGPLDWMRAHSLPARLQRAHDQLRFPERASSRGATPLICPDQPRSESRSARLHLGRR